MVIASIILTSQIKERTQIKVGSRINVMAVWKTCSRADLHVIFPTTWGGCQRDETQQVKKKQKPPRAVPARTAWHTPQGSLQSSVTTSLNLLSADGKLHKDRDARCPEPRPDARRAHGNHPRGGGWPDAPSAPSGTFKEIRTRQLYGLRARDTEGS